MTAHIPDPSELTPLSQSVMDEVLQKHAMYLRGQVGGARCVLKYRDLSGLDFQQYDLSQADFTGSLLIDVDMSNGIYIGASFFACDMRNADMHNGNFSRADFRGAYVAGANLSGANLSDVDLREGKIMKRGDRGVLEDRKRSAGAGAKAILSGAKMSDTNMAGAQATSADFSDSDMSGVIMTDANLSGASFEGANLADADLTGSDLSDTNMRQSIMTGTVMEGTEQHGMDDTAAITEEDMGSKLENLGKSLPELLEEHTLWVATAGRNGRQLDLSGYDLRDVLDLKKFPLTAIQCTNSNFLNQDLRGAELQSGIFDRSDFRDCDMAGADLRGASFKYAQMARVNLSGALMCPLEFKKEVGQSTLQRIDFSGANLRYAHLNGADLRDAILMGVDLTSALLDGCDLRRADLTGAILNGAKLENCRLDGAIIDFQAL